MAYRTLTLMTCLKLDSTKCRLTIVGIRAVFRGVSIPVAPDVPGPPPTWHAEIETLCKLCDQTFWFTVDTLPIEKVGQMWRAAISGEDYPFRNCDAKERAA